MSIQITAPRVLIIVDIDEIITTAMCVFHVKCVQRELNVVRTRVIQTDGDVIPQVVVVGNWVIRAGQDPRVASLSSDIDGSRCRDDGVWIVR